MAEHSKYREVSLASFFEDVAPYLTCQITDCHEITDNRDNLHVQAPEIRIYCGSEDCERDSFFDSNSYNYIDPGDIEFTLYEYHCRHCQKGRRVYPLLLAHEVGTHVLIARKFGEYPGFGKPTPREVQRMLGEELWALFLKGRKCENQSLGIGAFSYYRRIVEECKDDLCGAISQIADDLGLSDLKSSAEAAIKEQKFSSAMKLIEKALPESLFIAGHNPFTILHSKLSVGLHGLSEEECLARAESIRLVLVALAVRVRQLKNEHEQLRKTIGGLTQAERE